MPAPLPENENSRLASLHEFEILDTEAEVSLDELTKLAASICQTPTALISLIDRDRQWVKSCIGFGSTETSRESAFCAFTILNPDTIFIVEDAKNDERFFSNPLVVNEPNIRFYAGAPLVSLDGYALGSLCVIDYKPRSLSDQQVASLTLLARQVMSQFELRRALRKNEILSNRYQQILEQSPEGICLFDFEGKIFSVNHKFSELLGWGEGELLGKNMQSLIPEQELRQKPIPFDKLRAGETLVYERLLQRSDGSIITVEKSAKMIDQGTIQIIVRDITERKKIESELKMARDAALESARLKSAFLTNVSHEIRTPMNGIIGMTELLLSTPLDRVQHDYAKMIRQSSDSLLTIINDILDLGKIESGKLRFESIDFDVRDVVESTVELLGETAYRKNIEIASYVEASVPRLLNGDSGRLRQVLTNLVGNAVKFTENGEIFVSVKVEKDVKKGVVLRFTVSDTGIGIASQDLKNLFQPFIQADNSTTRQFGGTGLGLAISKQIVEMMGGKITVESRLHRGSQFSFTASFPRDAAVSENPSRVSGGASADSVTGAINGKRILVADKSSVVRRALRQYCSDWGLLPAEAETGEECLRQLRQAEEMGEPFSAAIVNMNLPDWEGFSLVRRIKTDNNLKITEVILTTSQGQRGDGDVAERIGAACYFTKPVRGTQLFDCLVTALQVSRTFSQASSPSLITRHSLRESSADDQQIPTFDQEDFRILIVEDNEVNRRVLTDQLKQIGVSADIAKDGFEGLEKLATSHYHLILMDCQMPRLDGYQTTREIRRLENEKIARGEELLPIPIVALTAHTFEGEREKCIAVGMDDYLSKPAKIKDLTAIIQRWCCDEASRRQSHKNLHTTDSFSNTEMGPAYDLEIKPEMTSNGFSFNNEVEREILELYLAETEKHFEEIKQAAANKNADIVARVAHAQLGNSLAVGAVETAELVTQISEMAKQNQFAGILNLVSEITKKTSF